MQRIERMRKVNEYVEALKKETKANMRQTLNDDQDAYKALLKSLLIQGLIKLIEPTVYIRLREADVELFEEIKDEAVSEYREMMVSQVKRFEGKDPEELPCNIIVDTKFLESIEDNEQAGCLGGFKMFAKKGRIVCSQTLDDRIDLAFGVAVPAIRYKLFPSMRKAE